jgi:hypothetical protein
MDTADTEFDLVVIGGGPGGYGAALYATSAGLKVAIVEKGSMGGTCLNRGCIPAKAYLETAAVHRHVAHAGEFGISSSAPTVDFAVSQARKQKIVDGIVKSLTGFMQSKKITILTGTGSLAIPPVEMLQAWTVAGGEGVVRGCDGEDAGEVARAEIVHEIEPLSMVPVAEFAQAAAERRDARLGPTDAEYLRTHGNVSCQAAARAGGATARQRSIAAMASSRPRTAARSRRFRYICTTCGASVQIVRRSARENLVMSNVAAWCRLPSKS